MEFLVHHLKYVPCKELIALSLLLKVGIGNLVGTMASACRNHPQTIGVGSLEIEICQGTPMSNIVIIIISEYLIVWEPLNPTSYLFHSSEIVRFPRTGNPGSTCVNINGHGREQRHGAKTSENDDFATSITGTIKSICSYFQ